MDCVHNDIVYTMTLCLSIQHVVISKLMYIVQIYLVVALCEFV